MKDHDNRIMVYNRTTGRLEPEIVLGEGAVRLLYGNRLGGLLAECVLKRRFFSRLFGKLQNTAISARKIATVAAQLKIDLSELEKPLEEYRSFNEFFTRTLKKEARPIDGDPHAVISPCDARLLAVPTVHGAITVNVKGSHLDLRRLLADDMLASKYTGGAMLIYRLCPADYHRFHFPEAGTPGSAVRTGGPLHSVNPMALATGRRILDTNLRERTELDTENGPGTICMVEVGAMCVGSIVQTYTPGAPVARGGEKGMFLFGGSAVIVLYEPGRIRVDGDIVEQSRRGIETLVRVGMRVGAYSETSKIAESSR